MLSKRIDQAYEETSLLPIIVGVFFSSIACALFFFLSAVHIFLSSDWSLLMVFNVALYFVLSFTLSMVMVSHICDAIVILQKDVELSEWHVLLKLWNIVALIVVLALQEVIFKTVDDSGTITFFLLFFGLVALIFNRFAHYLDVEEDVEVVEKEPMEELNGLSYEVMGYGGKGIRGVNQMVRHLQLLQTKRDILTDKEIKDVNARLRHLLVALECVEKTKIANTETVVERIEALILEITDEIGSLIREEEDRVVASIERKLTRMTLDSYVK